jgi:hypothetical protein
MLALIEVMIHNGMTSTEEAVEPKKFVNLFFVLLQAPPDLHLRYKIKAYCVLE